MAGNGTARCERNKNVTYAWLAGPKSQTLRVRVHITLRETRTRAQHTTEMSSVACNDTRLTKYDLFPFVVRLRQAQP